MFNLRELINKKQLRQIIAIAKDKQCDVTLRENLLIFSPDETYSITSINQLDELLIKLAPFPRQEAKPKKEKPKKKQSKPEKIKSVNPNWHSWTKQEIDLLKHLYKTFPIAYIAKALGMSKRAVYAKAIRLKLQKDCRHNKERVAVTTRLSPALVKKLKEYKRITGMSVSGICETAIKQLLDNDKEQLKP